MRTLSASPTFLALLIWALGGCAEPSIATDPSLALEPGSHSFTWNDGAGNPGRPVVVRYHLPVSYGPGTPVVLVMHGASRDGPRYFADWEPEAERYGFLLVVPEFGADAYPGSEWYNLGNMFGSESGSGPKPEAEWTFTAVERLFETVREATGGSQERFRIYGHSAGAQFVHRYLFFRNGGLAERAVAANAGWYTLPVDTVAYPYGLRGSGWSQEDILDAFAVPTTVLLGDQDTDSLQDNLRRTPEAIAQGPHRFARGHTFHSILAAEAERLGVALSWVLDTVPGAHHSDALMAPAAAAILAGG